MFDVNLITRRNIKSLTPYHVLRDNFLDNPEMIFLDNCENNFGSPLGQGYERYPSSSQQKIKEALAHYKNVDANQIILGNGSDELIDVIIRCFCKPERDSLLICEPTFGMFKVYAQLNDVDVLNAPLSKKVFQFDEKLILNTVQKNTKLIFICSPNNPTGTSISIKQLKKIANGFNGIIIIDEAYIDFSDKPSALLLINKIKNLIVLQTFSKAWGLAALRLGVAYGDPSVIEILNKVRPPYNISANSQTLLVKALQNSQVKKRLVNAVIAEKRKLKKVLIQFPFVKNIVESDANFFLVEVNDSNKLCDYLLKRNILISNRSLLHNCENRVRISIGTVSENKKLIQYLKQYN